MQAKHVPGLHGNVGMNVISIFLLTLSHSLLVTMLK